MALRQWPGLATDSISFRANFLGVVGFFTYRKSAQAAAPRGSVALLGHPINCANCRRYSTSQARRLPSSPGSSAAAQLRLGLGVFQHRRSLKPAHRSLVIDGQSAPGLHGTRRRELHGVCLTRLSGSRSRSTTSVSSLDNPPSPAAHALASRNIAPPSPALAPLPNHFTASIGSTGRPHRASRIASPLPNSAVLQYQITARVPSVGSKKSASRAQASNSASGRRDRKTDRAGRRARTCGRRCTWPSSPIRFNP
jgi:hypothetical protein